MAKFELRKRTGADSRRAAQAAGHREEENGKSGQVAYSVLGPKAVRQLREVYEQAMAVKAKYPESHVASKAAQKLIDAFEAVTQPDGPVVDAKWLTEVEPRGSA